VVFVRWQASEQRVHAHVADHAGDLIDPAVLVLDELHLHTLVARERLAEGVVQEVV